jgi:hypothetical protein
MTASAAGTVEHPGRNVAAKAGLNRSILDAGWTQFTRILVAKAECAGRRVVLAHPAYTSIDCHTCGASCARPRQDVVIAPSMAIWTPTSMGPAISQPGPGWALVKPPRLEKLPAPVGRAVTALGSSVGGSGGIKVTRRYPAFGVVHPGSGIARSGVR